LGISHAHGLIIIDEIFERKSLYMILESCNGIARPKAGFLLEGLYGYTSLAASGSQRACTVVFPPTVSD
jgi:hypothetical protein